MCVLLERRLRGGHEVPAEVIAMQVVFKTGDDSDASSYDPLLGVGLHAGADAEVAGRGGSLSSVSTSLCEKD
jgi:hypothetical protein